MRCWASSLGSSAVNRTALDQTEKRGSTQKKTAAGIRFPAAVWMRGYAAPVQASLWE